MQMQVKTSKVGVETFDVGVYKLTERKTEGD